MKFIAVLPVLFIVCWAGESTLSVDGSNYNFNYNTGDAGAHTRTESRSADGTVKGSFSYIDPNGNVRKVDYTAGAGGFKPSGDISVDKKTAEEAAALAEKAPKPPKEIDLKSFTPFTYAHVGVPYYHGIPFASYHNHLFAAPQLFF